jgi:2-keto-4-pentenoate hydratase/2-oxohepta-3-ene-1,7-dioic acid hydratase in catechol pathway
LKDAVVHLVTTAVGLCRVDDGSFALLDTAFPNVGAVIEQEGSLAGLSRCGVRDRLDPLTTPLLAPLGRPRALWGVGLNYHSKAAGAGRAVPTEPILYLAASSSMVAPDAELSIPEQTGELDYEAEIAVIIGRRLYQAAPDQVWASIAGITAANDVTARDVMRRTATPVLAKSFPGCAPLGASVLGVEQIAARDAIGVRSWVNGELRQDDSSAGLIFSIPELLSRISWFSALEPGDVVLTGTPTGTGQDRGVFLAPGDTVRIEVDGVLPLITHLVAPI